MCADVLDFKPKVIGIDLARPGSDTTAFGIIRRDGTRFYTELPPGYVHIKAMPAVFYFIATGPDVRPIGLCREKEKWLVISPQAEHTILTAIKEGLISAARESGSGCRRSQSPADESRNRTRRQRLAHMEASWNSPRRQPVVERLSSTRRGRVIPLR